MSTVSGVIGGVDTHADVHSAAVIDTSCGVVGVQSFPGNGTSSVGDTIVAFWNEVFAGIVAFWNEVFAGAWRLPPSAEVPRYCVGVPNAMKKTTKKRMNNAMPAHLSTGLHIASLAPRRPSRWTATFRTIHVHRSDRNARLR